ncbi:phosphomannomutase-like protein, partial [Corchorus olitorius]
KAVVSEVLGVHMAVVDEDEAEELQIALVTEMTWVLEVEIEKTVILLGGTADGHRRNNLCRERCLLLSTVAEAVMKTLVAEVV